MAFTIIKKDKDGKRAVIRVNGGKIETEGHVGKYAVKKVREAVINVQK